MRPRLTNPFDQLAEYMWEHKDEKLSPHVFDVAESKIM